MSRLTRTTIGGWGSGTTDILSFSLDPVRARELTSKFAFVELHREAGKMIAAQFLRNLVAAVPYTIHTVLTDNDIQFTNMAHHTYCRSLWLMMSIMRRSSLEAASLPHCSLQRGQKFVCALVLIDGLQCGERLQLGRQEQFLVDAHADSQPFEAGPARLTKRDEIHEAAWPTGSAPLSSATIAKSISRRVSRSKRNVFLCSDFEKLGSYDGVGRALRQMTRSGKLIQIGYGLYAKAAVSPSSGKPAPLVGIRRLAVEALGHLGKVVEISSFNQAYNSGRSTQVPTGRTLAVKDRVRRRIGYDGNYVVLERTRVAGALVDAVTRLCALLPA